MNRWRTFRNSHGKYTKPLQYMCYLISIDLTSDVFQENKKSTIEANKAITTVPKTFIFFIPNWNGKMYQDFSLFSQFICYLNICINSYKFPNIVEITLQSQEQELKNMKILSMTALNYTTSPSKHIKKTLCK